MEMSPPLSPMQSSKVPGKSCFTKKGRKKLERIFQPLVIH